MKREIVNIEKSPFNKIYFILLECGHTVERRRLSKSTKSLDCKKCNLRSRRAGSRSRVSRL